MYPVCSPCNVCQCYVCSPCLCVNAMCVVHVLCVNAMCVVRVLYVNAMGSNVIDMLVFSETLRISGAKQSV